MNRGAAAVLNLHQSKFHLDCIQNKTPMDLLLSACNLQLVLSKKKKTVGIRKKVGTGAPCWDPMLHLCIRQRRPLALQGRQTTFQVEALEVHHGAMGPSGLGFEGPRVQQEW